MGKSLAKDNEFLFHTPYLSLINTNIYWAKKDGNKGITEARLALNFNYDVNPTEVGRLLQLQINGTNKQYDLNTSSSSETINIAVPEIGEKFDNKGLKIQINKGLKCAESNYISKDPIVYETTIPSKENFQILNAEGQYQDDGVYIRITTNQEVKEGNLTELVSIEPKVDFPHGNGRIWFFNLW